MVPQPRVGASVQAGMWEDLRNKPSSAEQRRDQYSVRVNIPDARGNRYERWQLCVFLPKNGICSLCIYPTPYVGTSCVLHANNKSTSRKCSSACCPSRLSPSHLKKLFLRSNISLCICVCILLIPQRAGCTEHLSSATFRRYSFIGINIHPSLLGKEIVVVCRINRIWLTLGDADMSSNQS